MKRIRSTGSIAVLCLLLSLSAVAQKGPDKAYLQKIWDGWSSLNVDGQSQFYAQGAHVFYDIAPLKYSSWDEYQKGVKQLLADMKSASFHVNDDAQIHQAGNAHWGTATVDFTMTHKDGKVDKGTFRWTFVMEKQNGKWLLVHEHASVPMGG